jgi:hypothetical protein
MLGSGAEVFDGESLSGIAAFTNCICTLRASALPARGAGEGTAPPASSKRTHRIARQLIDKQKLDHGYKSPDIHPASGEDCDNENIAGDGSAMQFAGDLRDYRSLARRASEVRAYRGSGPGL